jgi:hypothetical protein
VIILGVDHETLARLRARPEEPALPRDDGRQGHGVEHEKDGDEQEKPATLLLVHRQSPFSLTFAANTSKNRATATIHTVYPHQTRSVISIVGPTLLDQAQGGFSVGGLTHHLDLGAGRQQGSEAMPRPRLVICDEYP